MKLSGGVLCMVLVMVFKCAHSENLASEAFKKLEKAFDDLNKKIELLSRHVMLRQLYMEEKTRSDADSGVKQIRNTRTGTRNYHAASHTSAGGSVLAIHDHANNDRTVGMGEFIAVLNGVEFRTRHNDYRLYMPHTTSGEWHAKEPIPFPDVPPEVLNKQNVSDQITEMREWFKAWRDQNNTIRDYTKYFKPVLCYLEGAWTTTTSGKIDEPFESDRHFIDASSWFDLQEKIRFTSYTGRKDNLENFAYLPTTIMNVTEDGKPQFAQWNYRILCYPLSRDIPLNRFRAVDDLIARMGRKRTYNDLGKSRSARFQLNPFDKDTWKDAPNYKRWGLLDELMAEVPGKDNYAGNLTDAAMGLPAYSRDPQKRNTYQDVSRYHRYYEVGRRGAMGTSTRHRGYSDDHVFMAMTTQPKVAGMDLAKCNRRARWNRYRRCTFLHQKWSYAIPLEIIYMTPLSKWNPYDLEYKGEERTPQGKTVISGGRNGGLTENKAYNGTNSKKFYRTPIEFYSGRELNRDSADTTKGAVGVLDKHGVVRRCKASGHRIHLPYIPGVGYLRQRYPIMPVHGEGSAVWKELEALKDIVLQSHTHAFAFREGLAGHVMPKPASDGPLELQFARSRSKNVHTHTITLSKDDVKFLKTNYQALEVISTEAAGHGHTVQVRYARNKDFFYIYRCDGELRCRDGHAPRLAILEDS